MVKKRKSKNHLTSDSTTRSVSTKPNLDARKGLHSRHINRIEDRHNTRIEEVAPHMHRQISKVSQNLAFFEVCSNVKSHGQPM